MVSSTEQFAKKHFMILFLFLFMFYFDNEHMSAASVFDRH